MASKTFEPQGNIGFGLMGMTWRAQPQPFEDSFKTLKRSIELGISFWNGGEFYGTPDKNSLHLLNQYFTKNPGDAEKVFLSIKGGLSAETHGPDGSPEHVKRSVENCLNLLGGKKKIDLFEYARFDPNVPFETTLTALAEFVKNGSIGGIGLSEVRAETIRKANEVVKRTTGQSVSAVEVEVSLWAPDIFVNGTAAACAELDIPIAAYSPLARGQITDNPIRKNSDFPDGDIKKTLPKYQDDVLEVNNRITDAAKAIAQRKGVTVPQVAIAWVKGQTGRKRTVMLEDGTEKEVTLGRIVPIPGATTIGRLEENTKPIKLTEKELTELDNLVKQYPVKGDRYWKDHMRFVDA